MRHLLVALPLAAALLLAFAQDASAGRRCRQRCCNECESCCPSTCASGCTSCTTAGGEAALRGHDSAAAGRRADDAAAGHQAAGAESPVAVGRRQRSATGPEGGASSVAGAATGEDLAPAPPAKASTPAPAGLRCRHRHRRRRQVDGSGANSEVSPGPLDRRSGGRRGPLDFALRRQVVGRLEGERLRHRREDRSEGRPDRSSASATAAAASPGKANFRKPIMKSASKPSASMAPISSAG